MKWITCALTIAILAGLIAFTPRTSGQGDGDAAPIYGIKIPTGYRDWPMISAALVGGPVNDLRVKLGNDLATKAYPEEKRPFPDGTIIARLAYQQVTSEENNKVFRAAAEQRGLPAEQIDKLLAASFVAGPRRTFSSWSRTRKNMPRPEVGASLNLPTANLTPRRYTKPGLSATRPPKTATSSSPVIHLTLT